MNRSACLGLVALLAYGCRAQEGFPPDQRIYSRAGADIAVYQRGTREVVARDLRTGRVRWRYTPQQKPPLPFAVMPEQSFVCPVVWTPSGNLVLRLHDEILVLSARDGALLWQKDSTDYWFCPAVAPDSGVLNITRWGRQLEKLDPEGARLWSFDLSGSGGPVAAPFTLSPSGDTLVRTREALLNVSPDGRLNWSVPLSVGTDGR